ncbi:nuclear transport factor 2 family protein [Robertkochia sediminum]|uniref:nuclear transport factor 2 family protein n=1 Tax=Robertkochia sediminum TaxID=2785326 RepID=UPI001932EA13|nr:nuclear transport factor 2 family protein [Robertkochia sediminum]MBL7471203.1 nuclear transport factor 2 family protein [Robertkochia sediminum]
MKKFARILAVITGALALIFTTSCSDDDSNSDAVDLNMERLVVGRALLEVQAPQVAEVLPFYTDDIEYHDPIVDVFGIEDMTTFLNKLILESSPNLVTIIEDETLVGDIYSATWVMSGDFLGVPYEAKGISIFKFLPNSAQVYYQRDYYSEGDIMATIPGLDEAILGFRTFYRCSVDPTFECPFPAGKTVPGGKIIPRSKLTDDQLVIGRQLVEINANDWFEVIPYLEPEYEYHDPIVDIYGPETMTEFLGRLFAGSSDLITTVEDETVANDIYMATWTMSGTLNGAPFTAPGMSIVKFAEGTTGVVYSRDYYTEGDVMIGVPELSEAVLGFREYYRAAVDPNYTGDLQAEVTF